VILAAIGHTVAIAVPGTWVAAEALLPQVGEAVPITVLGRVDDTVAVAVRVEGIADAPARLEAIPQAVPIAVGGQHRGGRQHPQQQPQQ
jgi:hypothetical protein